MGTIDEVSPVRAPQVLLSYQPSGASHFELQPLIMATDGTTGTGIVTVKWASAASGVSMAMTAFMSAFSVLLCATYTTGSAYGNDPFMVSCTTTVNVSATLSAALAAAQSTISTALATTITILAIQPTQQIDLLGVGTHRRLSYPTASYPAIVYDLNPQRWTNIADEVLIRPLYGTKKTLTKTATIQFSGFPSDLTIKEMWLGGGQRVAMSRSQFSAIYTYYQNPPNTLTAGHITWQPKDINNHTYQVLITSMEVGGTSLVELDHLFRTQQDWVTEGVTVSLRVVSTIS